MNKKVHGRVGEMAKWFVQTFMPEVLKAQFHSPVPA